MDPILILTIALLPLCFGGNNEWIGTQIAFNPALGSTIVEHMNNEPSRDMARSVTLWNPRVFVRTAPESTPHFDRINKIQKQKQELAKLMKTDKVQTRVVGGEVTTIEQLGGYLVALRYKDDFVCGGTLIEERFVISAAHCFLGRPEKSSWTVDGGITKLSETGVRSQLLDFVVPAIFKEKSMHMDVAVILLATPLKAQNIAPIALCRRRLDEGLHLSVSGWGLIDPEASSPFQSIRTVTVPVLSKAKCRETYKKALLLTQSMFCAGVLGSKDACTFDSGGPLVYNGPNGGPKELCGIVSFGISCASPKFAGVYTDVNFIKPFIKQTVDTFKRSTLFAS